METSSSSAALKKYLEKVWIMYWSNYNYKRMLKYARTYHSIYVTRCSNILKIIAAKPRNPCLFDKLIFPDLPLLVRSCTVQDNDSAILVDLPPLEQHASLFSSPV